MNKSDKILFANSKIINDIYNKALALTNDMSNLKIYRDELLSINTLGDSICDHIPSVIEFQSFLIFIHDVIASGDSNMRSILLRVVRMCLKHGKTELYVNVLYQNFEFGYVIVTSFERNSEFLYERIQALKIIKFCLLKSPKMFPLSFARSIAAVGYEVNEQLRNSSLDLIKDLCVVNSDVAIESGCIRAMIDAVLDPKLTDLTEELLIALFHSLNNENMRQYFYDNNLIRNLLSPLIDLDTQHSIEEQSSFLKSARNVFVSGMRTWSGLLLFTCDKFGLPILVKVLKESKVPVAIQEIILDALIELFEPFSSGLKYRKRRSYFESSGTNIDFNAKLKPQRCSASDTIIPVNDGSLKQTPLKPYANKKLSSSDLTSYATNSLNSRAPSIKDDANNSKRATSNIPHNWPINSAISNNAQQKRQKSAFNNINPFSIFSSFSSPSKTKKATNTSAASSRSNSPISSSSDRYSISSDTSQGSTSSSTGRTADDSGPLHHVKETDIDLIDPVFNILDNYTALLTSSLLHVNIIDSLCHFMNSSDVRSKKAGQLIISILRTVSEIFPEKTCSELISIPALVSYSAKLTLNISQSDKASEVLMMMSNGFSTMPDKRSEATCLYDNLNSTSHSSYTLSYVVGEVKKSNLSTFNLLRISVMNSQVNSTVVSNSKFKLINDVRSLTLVPVEKSEFIKQIESSRVVGNQGKDPYKWDWTLIDDILEFSLNCPERLTEALKTKFIRRVFGFYRCANDEKAYFANMEWNVQSLKYLDIAANLFHVLVGDEQGLSFLSSDRRGILLNDIACEIEALLNNASQGFHNILSSPNKANPFRTYHCKYGLSREYFRLLGRISTTQGGMNILEKSRVLSNISLLANHRSLDYISRVVITSLTFSDKGYLSKNILKLWACSNGCSYEFKIYMYNLLLVVLLSRPQEFMDWGIDVLCTYFTNEDSDFRLLYKILEILSQNKSMLRFFLSRKVSNIYEDSSSKAAIVRCVCIAEGIDYLKSRNILSKEIEYWKFEGITCYLNSIEKLLPQVLRKWSVPHRTIQPIPMNITAFAEFSASLVLDSFQKRVDDETLRQRDNNIYENRFRVDSNIPFINGNDSKNLAIDLEGLMCAPWNIEIKLSNQNNFPGTTSSCTNANSEYLKIDTFIDISDLEQPFSTNEALFDDTRIIKVRGILTDGRGLPSGHPIASNRVISSTLLFGTHPVSKQGEVRNAKNDVAKGNNLFGNSIKENNGSGKDSDKDPIGNNFEKDTVSFKRLNQSNPIVGNTPNNLELDWSHCKPGHRQGSGNIKELGDGKFAVEIPGEPVILIFSRTLYSSQSSNQVSKRSDQNDSSIFLGNNRFDRSYTGGFTYLVEVQYFIRLETQQAAFAPIPRHFFGELSRTLQGCSVLSENNIIRSMISVSRMESNSITDRSSALWALGHISASDLGLLNITNIDPGFVEWCTVNAIMSPNFALRATFFHVVGLISRCKTGVKALSMLNWSSSPSTVSALALPHDLRRLFSYVNNKETLSYNNHQSSVNCFDIICDFDNVLESEVIFTISKLPGIVSLCKESKLRLEEIKIKNPDVFKSRPLFLRVQRLFELYSFRLSLRRDIVSLFHIQAHKLLQN